MIQKGHQREKRKRKLMMKELDSIRVHALPKSKRNPKSLNEYISRVRTHIMLIVVIYYKIPRALVWILNQFVCA